MQAARSYLHYLNVKLQGMAGSQAGSQGVAYRQACVEWAIASFQGGSKDLLPGMQKRIKSFNQTDTHWVVSSWKLDALGQG